jgi:hypothetical protein
MPPGADYRCVVCKAVGKHWKSLCPRNTDPLCIFQRRKLAGAYGNDQDEPEVERECKKRKRSGGIFDNWEKDRHVVLRRIRLKAGNSSRLTEFPTAINQDAMNFGLDGLSLARQLPEAPSKVYHTLTLDLMSRYLSMSEIVNPRKPRPVAFDIWEQDDMPQEEIQRAASNPTSSESPAQENGRLTPYDYEDMDDQFDNEN